MCTERSDHRYMPKMQCINRYTMQETQRVWTRNSTMRDEQCAHKMHARESTTYVRHSMRNKTTQSHWSNFLLNFARKRVVQTHKVNASVRYKSIQVGTPRRVAVVVPLTLGTPWHVTVGDWCLKNVFLPGNYLNAVADGGKTEMTSLKPHGPACVQVSTRSRREQRPWAE